MLAQLGNRVQHALRAFTPEDAKALKATVTTFPKSEFYDLDQLLTQLAIGEAAVTILSEAGVPTRVVQTKLRAPVSRMGPADDVDEQTRASQLYAKYGTRADSQSARELLAARLEQPTATQAEALPAPEPKHKKAAGALAGGAGALGDFLQSKQGKRVEKEVVRGVFGLLRKSL